MMKRTLLSATAVIVMLSFISMNINGEHYEDNEITVRRGKPYILELGDLMGGTRLNATYQVTSYWLGGDEERFRMSVLRNGTTEYSIDGSTGNVTYIAHKPGNYSIKWETTYGNSQDYKRFRYEVNVSPTNEIDHPQIEIVSNYSPMEFQRGSNGTITLNIYNNNIWLIRMNSADLKIDIESGDLHMDLDNLEIEPGSFKSINLSVIVDPDETPGSSIMDISVMFSMKVYESWYENIQLEWKDINGPKIVEKDTDGDSYPDNMDEFPDDPSEFSDSDDDGVGNNADPFPLDPNEWSDMDGDGIGDNSDVFPEDPNEWSDMDGDSIGDNSDAFPKDPSASKDSDNDGYPDEWNTGKNEKDSTNELILDRYPQDPTRWKKPEDSPFPPFTIIPLLIAIISILFRKRREVL